MKFIWVGSGSYLAPEAVKYIIELCYMADNSALIKALKESGVVRLLGRPHRTAIFGKSGKVILSPMSAKGIYTRIQRHEW